MPGHSLVDIQNTYGCTFIGLIVSILFFGVTVCQTWIYFWQYSKRDPKLLRFFVLVIFSLDAVHTILCTYSVYWYLILNFGNVENLEYSMWAMDIQIDFNALVELLVQLFYARRVYVVSNSIIIPAIIVLLGANTFALGCVFSVRATALKAWSRYHSLIAITCIGLGSGIVADSLIAFSMCWFLYHKRTGFARTDSMIMTLMSYSINSGLVTCLLTIAVLITFATNTSSMIWTIFYWPMSKAYANSLLAMLNSRDHVRERSTTDKVENAIGLSSFRMAQGNTTDRFRSKHTTVSINVHHSETTDFPFVKDDHDVESSTAEMRRSVRYLCFFAASSLIKYCS
ncbi:hypothetical protein V8E53_014591 [Lactarius tabidus]